MAKKLWDNSVSEPEPAIEIKVQAAGPVCPKCGALLRRKVKDKGGYRSAVAKLVCPKCGYASEYEEVKE